MNWFARLFRVRKVEQQLDAELRFHFESQVADKVAAGMNEPAARRATRLEFGGHEQIKQECRESRGTLWLTSIVDDLRFGARLLTKSRGFSLTAIMVLALGIGVNTFAFSLYNLLTLKSIPVRDPATVVGIERRSPENINPGVPWSSIRFYRDNARTLSAVMASMGSAPMTLDRDPQRIHPGFVSANYFSELDPQASAGRLFDPSREDAVSAPPVAVLSYKFWKRRFQGDSSVIGRTITLDGKPATIIGVTSEFFSGLGANSPDLWLPLQQHSYFIEGSKPLDDPSFDGTIGMSGRLAPGVTAAAAAEELLTLTNRLRPLYPKVIWDNEYIIVTPGAHFFSLNGDGHAPPILPIVFSLVGLILAVACANLAGLLMARGVSRQHEIQLRLNLGARRSRVFRQLFTESILLGLLGTIVALPLSSLAVRMILIQTDAPAWMSSLPDWRVAAFTAALGCAASILFGFLPALRVVLGKNNSKAFAHKFVVCAQVAASCVLLILASLLVRATLHTMYSDPGFGYQQVLSIDPGMSDHGYTPAAARAYLEALQSRLRTVNGVVSASMVLFPPLDGNVHITSIDVAGRRVLIYPNWVGIDFFRTMDIPILRGRAFRQDDKDVVILSQSLALKRWPNEDPIGKFWKDSKGTVIGIAGNTRAMEMNNTDATEMYYPAEAEQSPEMSILVKTSGSPEGLTPRIISLAGSTAPDSGAGKKLFPAVTLLKAGFRKNVAQAERITLILSLLGGIAIFLATVGLVGLVAYAVTQRTREIAIRLAVGAGRLEICRTILRHFAWPAIIGLVAGIGATAALSQILRRMLYGISGLDPASYLAAILALCGILGVAAILPIRRAFRMDVARILHAE